MQSKAGAKLSLPLGSKMSSFLPRVRYSTLELWTKITGSWLAGDAASLVLLTVYEEAPPPATADMSNAQAGGSGGAQSTIQPASADEEEEETGWKYYDLQLPQSRTNLNKAAWQSSISEAEAALSRLLPGSGTDKRNGRSESVGSNKQKESPALKKLRKRQEVESTRGLQGEEGPDFDPEDYWAGCESSDDENGEKDQATHETLEEEDEDDYWNAYGGQDTGNNGSVVDSGHYEADQGLAKEEAEEDHTMRYSHQDSSDSVGHFEYARGSHENDDANHDYSFEDERGEQDGPSQGGRVLIDDSTLNSRSRAGTGNQNDSFLDALQSSLERVSSSSSQPEAENEPIEPNIIPHMNGVPAHGQRERMSPTFDSAIQKGIAGLWETYLLSSALGGGGKSREIAAYEFMELVQEVIHGQDH
jgi:hypothetical protein